MKNPAMIAREVSLTIVLLQLLLWGPVCCRREAGKAGKALSVELQSNALEPDYSEEPLVGSFVGTGSEPEATEQALRPKEAADNTNGHTKTFERVVLEGSKIIISCPYWGSHVAAEEKPGSFWTGKSGAQVNGQLEKQFGGQQQLQPSDEATNLKPSSIDQSDDRASPVTSVSQPAEWYQLQHQQQQQLQQAYQRGDELSVGTAAAATTADITESNRTTELHETTSANLQSGLLVAEALNQSAQDQDRADAQLEQAVQEEKEDEGPEEPLWGVGWSGTSREKDSADGPSSLSNSITSVNVNETGLRKRTNMFRNWPASSGEAQTDEHYSHHWHINTFGQLVIENASQEWAANYTCLEEGRRSEMILVVLAGDEIGSNEAGLESERLVLSQTENKRPTEALPMQFSYHEKFGNRAMKGGKSSELGRPDGAQLNWSLEAKKLNESVEASAQSLGSATASGADKAPETSSMGSSSVSMAELWAGQVELVTPSHGLNAKRYPAHLVKGESLPTGQLKLVPGLLYTKQQFICPSIARSAMSLQPMAKALCYVGQTVRGSMTDPLAASCRTLAVRLLERLSSMQTGERQRARIRPSRVNVSTVSSTGEACPMQMADLVWFKDGRLLQFDANGRGLGSDQNVKLINFSDQFEAASGPERTGRKGAGCGLERGRVLEVEGLHRESAGRYLCAFRLERVRAGRFIRALSRRLLRGPKSFDRSQFVSKSFDNDISCCDEWPVEVREGEGDEEETESETNSSSYKHSRTGRQATLSLGASDRNQSDSQQSEASKGRRGAILEPILLPSKNSTRQTSDRISILESILRGSMSSRLALSHLKRILSDWRSSNPLTVVQVFSLAILERPANSCNLWNTIQEAGTAYIRRKLANFRRLKRRARLLEQIPRARRLKRSLTTEPVLLMASEESAKQANANERKLIRSSLGRAEPANMRLSLKASKDKSLMESKLGHQLAPSIAGSKLASEMVEMEFGDQKLVRSQSDSQKVLASSALAEQRAANLSSAGLHCCSLLNNADELVKSDIEVSLGQTKRPLRLSKLRTRPFNYANEGNLRPLYAGGHSRKPLVPSVHHIQQQREAVSVIDEPMEFRVNREKGEKRLKRASAWERAWRKGIQRSQTSFKMETNSMRSTELEAVERNDGEFHETEKPQWSMVASFGADAPMSVADMQTAPAEPFIIDENLLHRPNARQAEGAKLMGPSVSDSMKTDDSRLEPGREARPSKAEALAWNQNSGRASNVAPIGPAVSHSMAVLGVKLKGPSESSWPTDGSKLDDSSHQPYPFRADKSQETGVQLVSATNSKYQRGYQLNSQLNGLSTQSRRGSYRELADIEARKATARELHPLDQSMGQTSALSGGLKESRNNEAESWLGVNQELLHVSSDAKKESIQLELNDGQTALPLPSDAVNLAAVAGNVHRDFSASFMSESTADDLAEDETGINESLMWTAGQYLYMHMRAIATSSMFGVEVAVEWSNERANSTDVNYLSDMESSDAKKDHNYSSMGSISEPSSAETPPDSAPFATIDVISGQNLELQCTAQALGRLPDVRWYKRVEQIGTETVELEGDSSTIIRRIGRDLYWPLTELDLWNEQKRRQEQHLADYEQDRNGFRRKLRDEASFVCSHSNAIFDNLVNQTFTVVSSLQISQYNDAAPFRDDRTKSDHHSFEQVSSKRSSQYACIVDADVRRNYATLEVRLREAPGDVPLGISKRLQARSARFSSKAKAFSSRAVSQSLTDSSTRPQLAPVAAGQLSNRENFADSFSFFRESHLHFPLASYSWVPIMNASSMLPETNIDHASIARSQDPIIPITLSTVLLVVFGLFLVSIYLTVRTYRSFTSQNVFDSLNETSSNQVASDGTSLSPSSTIIARRLPSPMPDVPRDSEADHVSCMCQLRESAFDTYPMNMIHGYPELCNQAALMDPLPNGLIDEVTSQFFPGTSQSHASILGKPISNLNSSLIPLHPSQRNNDEILTFSSSFHKDNKQNHNLPDCYQPVTQTISYKSTSTPTFRPTSATKVDLIENPLNILNGGRW